MINITLPHSFNQSVFVHQSKPAPKAKSSQIRPLGFRSLASMKVRALSWRDNPRRRTAWQANERIGQETNGSVMRQAGTPVPDENAQGVRGTGPPTMFRAS